MIKALIFDCFGVIYPDASWNYFNELKDKGKLTREYLAELNEQADLGRISEEQYYKLYSNKSGIPAAEIREGIYKHFVVDERVVELIKKCSKVFKIGMITNAAEFDMAILKRDKIEDLFDTVIVSARAGVTKPDPKIFKLALDKLKVTPEESIFIDDREENIAAARTLGLGSILFNGYKQLNNQIERYL